MPESPPAALPDAPRGPCPGARASLRHLVAAYLFPDRDCLPGLYTAHVPKYVLRSPSDPYGASYRKLLARDVAARLRTLEAVFPGAERALSSRGVAASMDLYSRTYEASFRHTFGQYFAMKAVDHVLGYLREACPPSRMGELTARLQEVVGRAGAAGPTVSGMAQGSRQASAPEAAGLEKPQPLVGPLMA